MKKLLALSFVLALSGCQTGVTGIGGEEIVFRPNIAGALAVAGQPAMQAPKITNCYRTGIGVSCTTF